MSQKATNSQTISKIFTSRKIILDLAKLRGFNIDDYEFDVEINGSTTVTPDYVPDYKEAESEE